MFRAPLFTLLGILILGSVLGGLAYYRYVIIPAQMVVTRDKQRVDDLNRMLTVYKEYRDQAVNLSRFPTDCSDDLIRPIAKSGWPVDPLNTGDYVYNKHCSQEATCFCAKLEGNTQKNNSTTNACAFFTDAKPEDLHFYCVGE